jgi:hypothetical protein
LKQPVEAVKATINQETSSPATAASGQNYR